VWSSLVRGLTKGKTGPKTPEGTRIYAIGDVHGRADLLVPLFKRIDTDVAAHPSSNVIEVLLGDYVDRGPQSREVLDILISRRRRRRMVYLKGNHETYITEFLRDPAMLDQWRYFGGIETLISYGVVPSMNCDERARRELATAFASAMPATHRLFLTSLKGSFACGDYFFVHAGVRPGVPLSQQSEQDLLLIREEFLLHEEGFGKIIVHGHTPVIEPDVRPNRINIDTGAYATGVLTGLVLDGEAISFL
jgi:serine/threonine protein phosphatase 1